VHAGLSGPESTHSFPVFTPAGKTESYYPKKSGILQGRRVVSRLVLSVFIPSNLPAAGHFAVNQDPL